MAGAENLLRSVVGGAWGRLKTPGSGASSVRTKVKPASRAPADEKLPRSARIAIALTLAVLAWALVAFFVFALFWS